MDRSELFGEWKVEKPKPSPGPWAVVMVGVRRERDRIGNPFSFYVVLDVSGRIVADCDTRADAEWIAAHGPPYDDKAGA